MDILIGCNEDHFLQRQIIIATYSWFWEQLFISLTH